MVVMRVEVEREAVRLAFLIAPRELARDARRFAVAKPRADVQRAVVVRHAQFGLLADRFALLGITLDERGRRRCAQPRLIVEAAVDDDRPGSPRGLDDGNGPVCCGGRVRPGPPRPR